MTSTSLRRRVTNRSASVGPGGALSARSDPLGGQLLADGLRVSSPSDPLEREAEATANRVMRGEARTDAGRRGGADATSKRGQNLLAREPRNVVHRSSDAVLREPMIVQVVDANRDPGDIAEDSVNTMEAILVHYRSALESFETVVNNASANEAAPTGSALAAIDAASKFVFQEVLSTALKMIPGGALVSTLVRLSSNVAESIQKQRKAQRSAAESNRIKNFVVSLRTRIDEAHAELLSTKVDTRERIQRRVATCKGQEEVRDLTVNLAIQNDKLNRAAKTTHSIAALSTRIAASWVNASQAPNMSVAAYLAIRLDRNWQIVAAEIKAPRGDRLAEWLTMANGGQVELSAIPCRRTVVWMPEGPPNPLPELIAEMSPENHVDSATGTWGSEPFFDAFEQNLSTKPLPSTMRLTGSTTG